MRFSSVVETVWRHEVDAYPGHSALAAATFARDNPKGVLY